MARRAKIKDNPDLEKDLETGVVINNNRTNLINRKLVKQNILNQQEETQRYKDLCNTLMDRLSQIEEKLNNPN